VTAKRLLGLLALAALAALVGCTGGQRTAVADFFGGFFSSAAPVLDAAGQPWFGALSAWAGKMLLDHPLESAGATLAAAAPINHWVNGTWGTKRRRNIRETRTAKKQAARQVAAQMQALDAETTHAKVLEKAQAKVARAAARKNAAYLAAQKMPG
jgi:hypothetical protein